MEGQPIDAMRRNPPFIKRQIIGGGFVVGLDIIILNGLQMDLQESNDLFVRHKDSKSVVE
jgi:hypothetical protein